MRLRDCVMTTALVLTCSTGAAAAVQTKVIDYTQNGTALQGLIAWDDAVTAKRPGILVIHEWWGHNEHARNAARRLAEAGYVAFAVDMFGKGKVTTHPDDAMKFMSEATKDPAVVAARFNAGLAELKKDPHVNPEKVGAIGYCFGGGVALNMARAGADLNAVVSFHGVLNPKPDAPPAKGTIKPRLLILTGEADPMVPASQVDAFKREMTAAGARFDVVAYPGAKHGFTNPDADKAGMPALAYNPAAAKESWAEMLKFLGQVFR
jgi:dienelactone hydrolase